MLFEILPLFLQLSSRIYHQLQIVLFSGLENLTIHDRHALQHGLPILFPHFNLVIHSFHFFKRPSEPGRFGIVLQIDLFNDFKIFFQLLSFGIFGILLFLGFGEFFAELHR